MNSSGPGIRRKERSRDTWNMHPLINKILQRCFTEEFHWVLYLRNLNSLARGSNRRGRLTDRISTFETSLKSRYTS